MIYIYIYIYISIRYSGGLANNSTSFSYLLLRSAFLWPKVCQRFCLHPSWNARICRSQAEPVPNFPEDDFQVPPAPPAPPEPRRERKEAGWWFRCFSTRNCSFNNKLCIHESALPTCETKFRKVFFSLSFETAILLKGHYVWREPRTEQPASNLWESLALESPNFRTHMPLCTCMTRHKWKKETSCGTSASKGWWCFSA